MLRLEDARIAQIRSDLSLGDDIWDFLPPLDRVSEENP